jgi:uncharacterized protein
MESTYKYFNRFLLILLFVVGAFFSVAQTKIKVIPRPTNPYMAVNDFANLLSPTNKMALEMKLRKFYDSTSNEMLIVTLPKLDGFEVEDVAYAYAKEWNFGNKAKDNGILLLISLDPRKVRFEVGKGLEGAIPDGMAGTIIRREIIPLLKESKYYEAFDQGTSAVIKAAKGEYEMDDPGDRRDSGKKGGSFMSVFIMIFIIFIILIIISRRGGGNGNGGMLSRRGYRRWGGPSVFDYGPWSGGGGSSGGGSGGGLGDFGGFGGGDFGGGGASGDW